MVSSVKPELMQFPFLSVAPRESVTINTLTGPRPNNSDVYLTTFISTQNHTVAGKIIVCIRGTQVIEWKPNARRKDVRMNMCNTK